VTVTETGYAVTVHARWARTGLWAAAAAIVATAAPAAPPAQGARAPMSARAPSAHLRDPADTPGKLDVRSVRLAQSAGSLVLSFTLRRSFSIAELAGAPNRGVCLTLVPRGRPGKGQKVCLIGPSGRHALFRLPLVRGGPRPRWVTAHVAVPRPTEVRVTFGYAGIGFRAGRIDWSVSSVWKGGAACTTPCRDLVPDRGRAPARIDRFARTGCVAAGTSRRFNGPAAGRMVALTFDDGPSPYTREVLSVLSRYHAHATFFEIGRQVGPLAAVSRSVLRAGDVIGDHTWSHPVLNAANTAAQVTPTQRAIRAATGFTPCILRPPDGTASAEVVGIVRSLGLLTIQWDVDPADWSLPGASVIAQRVLAAVHPGAIVIMHDGGGNRAETVAALQTIVPTLIARGYRLVKVPRLLGLSSTYTYRP
jgi:peptidoglycan/xylan/chitin deacetylase (PgdA/CDA1 family)